MIVEVTKEFRFEASHQLPNHDGKCARLHGHSWVLRVTFTRHVMQTKNHPKEGMVVDFADLKAAVQPIIDKLDHHHLGSGMVQGGVFVMADAHLANNHFPTVPTSENILIWIGDQLAKYCWTKLELSETCTSAAVLRRDQGAYGY